VSLSPLVHLGVALATAHCKEQRSGRTTWPRIPSILDGQLTKLWQCRAKSELIPPSLRDLVTKISNSTATAVPRLSMRLQGVPFTVWIALASSSRKDGGNSSDFARHCLNFVNWPSRMETGSWARLSSLSAALCCAPSRAPPPKWTQGDRLKRDHPLYGATVVTLRALTPTTR